MRRLALTATLALTLIGCAPAGPKEIAVVADENGFTPKTVSVKQGETLVLIVTRTSDATCATEAVFAETGRRYELPKGEAVRIELPTDTKGTLHYSCAMDMYKGEVVVQ